LCYFSTVPLPAPPSPPIYHSKDGSTIWLSLFFPYNPRLSLPSRSPFRQSLFTTAGFPPPPPLQGPNCCRVISCVPLSSFSFFIPSIPSTTFFPSFFFSSFHRSFFPIAAACRAVRGFFPLTIKEGRASAVSLFPDFLLPSSLNGCSLYFLFVPPLLLCPHQRALGYF